MSENGRFHSILDSHFHTQSMLQRGMDVFSIYNSLFSEDFVGGIDIGCNHHDLPERYELLKDYPQILLSGAMGPWEAGVSETKPTEPELGIQSVKSFEQIKAELETLKENILRYNAAFIGEIGLDYYWDYGTHEKQHLIFETQMRWANEMGKCVLIHDRDADEDTIDVIRRLGPSKGGVIHCFNGCRALMETALEHNYFISFAGNLTFKKNENLRELIKEVPLDRLLLETDSPYLTPVPFRGKDNSPAYVIHTFACAAQTLGLPLEELSQRISLNYKELCSR